MSSANAADIENRGAVSLIVDNDIFTGSDNNYTNGIGLTYTTGNIRDYSDDSFAKRWVKGWSFLPFVDADERSTYASWTIVQQMNTPDDITIPEPDINDQPYSGLLYVDSLLQSRKGQSAYIWGLRLGTVGPSSQADHTQRWVHRKIGADTPRGWHTQLPDELIVNAYFTHGYVLREGSIQDSAWRLVTTNGISFGNYLSAVHTGIYAEWGWNLPNALGGSALRDGLDAAFTAGAVPQQAQSISFFLAAGGHGVAHYMPLDGTVFRNSRSVNSEPLIGALSGGVTYRFKRFAASFSVSYFTDAFEEQRQSGEFGSFNLAWFP